MRHLVWLVCLSLLCVTFISTLNTQGCKSMDVVFVVPGSDDIGRSTYDAFKRIIFLLLRGMTVTDNDSRFGIVIYGSSRAKVIPLSGNRLRIGRPLARTVKPGGRNNPSLGLRRAEFLLTLGKRYKVPRVIVLFYQPVNKYAKLHAISTAASIRNKNIRVIALGLGTQYEMKALKQIATKKHAYRFKNIFKLRRKAREIPSYICKVTQKSKKRPVVRSPELLFYELTKRKPRKSIKDPVSVYPSRNPDILLQSIQNNSSRGIVTACHLKPVLSHPRRFLQAAGRGRWKEFDCAEGTLFRYKDCGCTASSPVRESKVYRKRDDQKCEPEVYLPFCDGLKDFSGKETYIQNNGVVIENGTAYFDGKSRLHIPRFSDTKYGKTVIVKIRFKLEQQKDHTENEMPLISNGQCNKRGCLEKPSIAITTMQNLATFKATGSNNHHISFTIRDDSSSEDNGASTNRQPTVKDLGKNNLQNVLTGFTSADDDNSSTVVRTGHSTMYVDSDNSDDANDNLKRNKGQFKSNIKTNVVYQTTTAVASTDDDVTESRKQDVPSSKDDDNVMSTNRVLRAKKDGNAKESIRMDLPSSANDDDVMESTNQDISTKYKHVIASQHRDLPAGNDDKVVDSQSPVVPSNTNDDHVLDSNSRIVSPSINNNGVMETKIRKIPYNNDNDNIAKSKSHTSLFSTNDDSVVESKNDASVSPNDDNLLKSNSQNVPTRAQDENETRPKGQNVPPTINDDNFIESKSDVVLSDDNDDDLMGPKSQSVMTSNDDDKVIKGNNQVISSTNDEDVLKSRSSDVPSRTNNDVKKSKAQDVPPSDNDDIVIGRDVPSTNRNDNVMKVKTQDSSSSTKDDNVTHSESNSSPFSINDDNAVLSKTYNAPPNTNNVTDMESKSQYVLATTNNVSEKRQPFLNKPHDVSDDNGDTVPYNSSEGDDNANVITTPLASDNNEISLSSTAKIKNDRAFESVDETAISTADSKQQNVSPTISSTTKLISDNSDDFSNDKIKEGDDRNNIESESANGVKMNFEKSDILKNIITNTTPASDDSLDISSNRTSKDKEEQSSRMRIDNLNPHTISDDRNDLKGSTNMYLSSDDDMTHTTSKTSDDIKYDMQNYSVRSTSLSPRTNDDDIYQLSTTLDGYSQYDRRVTVSYKRDSNVNDISQKDKDYNDEMKLINRIKDDDAEKGTTPGNVIDDIPTIYSGDSGNAITDQDLNSKNLQSSVSEAYVDHEISTTVNYANNDHTTTFYLNEFGIVPKESRIGDSRVNKKSEHFITLVTAGADVYASNSVTKSQENQGNKFHVNIIENDEETASISTVSQQRSNAVGPTTENTLSYLTRIKNSNQSKNNIEDEHEKEIIKNSALRDMDSLSVEDDVNKKVENENFDLKVNVDGRMTKSKEDRIVNVNDNSITKHDDDITKNDDDITKTSDDSITKPGADNRSKADDGIIKVSVKDFIVRAENGNLVPLNRYTGNEGNNGTSETLSNKHIQDGFRDNTVYGTSEPLNNKHIQDGFRDNTIHDTVNETSAEDKDDDSLPGVLKDEKFDKVEHYQTKEPVRNTSVDEGKRKLKHELNITKKSHINNPTASLKIEYEKSRSYGFYTLLKEIGSTTLPVEMIKSDALKKHDMKDNSTAPSVVNRKSHSPERMGVTHARSPIPLSYIQRQKPFDGYNSTDVTNPDIKANISSGITDIDTLIHGMLNKYLAKYGAFETNKTSSKKYSEERMRVLDSPSDILRRKKVDELNSTTVTQKSIKANDISRTTDIDTLIHNMLSRYLAKFGAFEKDKTSSKSHSSQRMSVTDSPSKVSISDILRPKKVDGFNRTRATQTNRKTNASSEITDIDTLIHNTLSRYLAKYGAFDKTSSPEAEYLTPLSGTKHSDDFIHNILTQKLTDFGGNNFLQNTIGQLKMSPKTSRFDDFVHSVLNQNVTSFDNDSVSLSAIEIIKRLSKMSTSDGFVHTLLNQNLTNNIDRVNMSTKTKNTKPYKGSNAHDFVYDILIQNTTSLDSNSSQKATGTEYMASEESSDDFVHNVLNYNVTDIDKHNFSLSAIKDTRLSSKISSSDDFVHSLLNHNLTDDINKKNVSLSKMDKIQSFEHTSSEMSDSDDFIHSRLTPNLKNMRDNTFSLQEKEKPNPSIEFGFNPGSDYFIHNKLRQNMLTFDNSKDTIDIQGKDSGTLENTYNPNEHENEYVDKKEKTNSIIGNERLKQGGINSYLGKVRYSSNELVKNNHSTARGFRTNAFKHNKMNDSIGPRVEEINNVKPVKTNPVKNKFDESPTREIGNILQNNIPSFYSNKGGSSNGNARHDNIPQTKTTDEKMILLFNRLTSGNKPWEEKNVVSQQIKAPPRAEISDTDTEETNILSKMNITIFRDKIRAIERELKQLHAERIGTKHLPEQNIGGEKRTQSVSNLQKRVRAQSDDSSITVNTAHHSVIQNPTFQFVTRQDEQFMSPLYEFFSKQLQETQMNKHNSIGLESRNMHLVNTGDFQTDDGVDHSNTEVGSLDTGHFIVQQDPLQQSLSQETKTDKYSQISGIKSVNNRKRRSVLYQRRFRNFKLRSLYRFKKHNRFQNYANIPKNWDLSRKNVNRKITSVGKMTTKRKTNQKGFQNVVNPQDSNSQDQRRVKASVQKWKTVTLKIVDGMIIGMHGKHKSINSITGDIKSTFSGIQIGQGDGHQNFRGYIDEVYIYLCDPGEEELMLDDDDDDDNENEDARGNMSRKNSRRRPKTGSNTESNVKKQQKDCHFNKKALRWIKS